MKRRTKPVPSNHNAVPFTRAHSKPRRLEEFSRERRKKEERSARYWRNES